MSTVVIRGVVVFDPRAGAARPDQDVVIDGERIVAVGPNAGARVAADRTLDGSGATLLPGLIDCHVHITASAAPDYPLRALKELVPFQALRGAANAAQLLRMGFTTVRDLGATGYSAIALRQAIQQGLLPGPRLLAAGHSLTVTGGHGDSYFRPEVHVERPGIINGPAEAARAVRQEIKLGADAIKLLVTGGVMTDGSDVGALQWSEEELAAAIGTAHRLGRRVAGHCHGAAGAKAAVRLGLDTLEHGTLLDEEALELMAERGTFYVPTLVAGRQIAERGTEAGIPEYAVRKARQVVDAHRRSVRLARELGVRIAFGTDSGTPFNPAGANAVELVYLVEAGLTPAEALRAITLGAAEALGLADELGTVEPGKLADLVLVDGDPLADVGLLRDPGRIRAVLQGGRLVPRAEG